MGTVYRAWDEQLGRDVALKIFRDERTSADDLRRQQSEVRILARLTHPSLVTLYDVVADDDGRAVLVLEYVPGTDLRARLARGPLPERTAAAIGRDAARALAHIHSRGIIHRDVSPGNILLPARRRGDHTVDAKLTDLGIARLVDDGHLTATGTIVGTADYLSPEQAQGLPLSSASDVYSLGLVLLECLTGERAFSGTAMESAVARVSRDPDLPDHLDARWRHLLAAMTHREPAQRPSAAEVAEGLTGSAAASTSLDGETAEAMEAGDERTTAVLPSPTRAAASRPSPIEPRGADVTTRNLAPARASDPRRRRDLSPSARVIALASAAALVLAAVLVVLFTYGFASPQPEATLPTVPGRLGDHLKQLHRDVSS